MLSDLDMANQMPVNPGTFIHDRYRIESVCVSSAASNVYTAWDTKISQKVVIKEYCLYIQQVMEAALLRIKLQNGAGIVQIYDCFLENDRAYVILEHIEGESLRSYLRHNGPIPFDRAIAMITPLLDFLTCLHKEGILHGNIEPGSIVVDQNGFMKLADLDVSYRLSDKGNCVFPIVCPGYAPPEQYFFGNAGPQVDIYAVGAVMYTMLTGIQLPESIERMKRDTLAEPISQYCQITLQQEKAILRAIHLNPQKRTPTAVQFLKELTEVHQEKSKPILRKMIDYLVDHSIQGG